MIVFAALHTTPDYTSSRENLVSVHLSLYGAIAALYPDRVDFQQKFTKRGNKDIWTGPDGFGEVRQMEVQE